MSRILLLVNGLGLGNSTRSYGVIQQLFAKGAEVEVVTSNNGLWFFADKPEVSRVTEIPSLQYGQKAGRINIAATLSQAGAVFDTIRRADAVISDTIARFRPSSVVTDSIYSVRPTRRAGLPLVAINNSDMVVRRMARGGCPADVIPQFLVVELSDYLFHRLLPDLVISPRLGRNDTTQGGNFRWVGPIVRDACRPEPISTKRPEKVAVMLSGSVFGSRVAFKRDRSDVAIDVLGRPTPSEGNVPKGVTFHGKVRDSMAFIRSADLVVVNGGFSAVSEALFLRKPTVVIPVPRHAEQWVNGDTVGVWGLASSRAKRSWRKRSTWRSKTSTNIVQPLTPCHRFQMALNTLQNLFLVL